MRVHGSQTVLKNKEKELGTSTKFEDSEAANIEAVDIRRSLQGLDYVHITFVTGETLEVFPDRSGLFDGRKTIRLRDFEVGGSWTTENVRTQQDKVRLMRERQEAYDRVKIEVHVTQEDIDEGVKNHCQQCPVARALSRAATEHFGEETWADTLTASARLGPVGGSLIWRGLHDLEVSDFIRRFDQHFKVEPIDFQITMEVHA